MANPSGTTVGTWTGDVVHSPGGLNVSNLTGAFVKDISTSGLVTLQQSAPAWLTANATQVTSTPGSAVHGDVIQYTTAQTGLSDHFDTDLSTAITSVGASEDFGFQYFNPNPVISRWVKYYGECPELTVQLSVAPPIATLSEAQTGTATTPMMTPQRSTDHFDKRVWKGTKDEYDAITTKDPDTLYFYPQDTIDGSALQLWTGTQDEYDALTSTDSNTLYVVPGDALVALTKDTSTGTSLDPSSAKVFVASGITLEDGYENNVLGARFNTYDSGVSSPVIHMFEGQSLKDVEATITAGTSAISAANSVIFANALSKDDSTDAYLGINSSRQVFFSTGNGSEIDTLDIFKMPGWQKST